MTSQRLPPGIVGVIVSCTISLLFSIPAWPADTSQTIVGSGERPTFVSWPEKGLGLSIDLTGFKKEIDQVKPDGRRYIMASHPKTKLDVSITLEKVATKASAKGCLEQLRLIQNDSSVTRGQDIALNTTGEIPTLGLRFRNSEESGWIKRMCMRASRRQRLCRHPSFEGTIHHGCARFFQSIFKTLRLQPPPSRDSASPSSGSAQRDGAPTAAAPPKEMVPLSATCPPQ